MHAVCQTLPITALHALSYIISLANLQGWAYYPQLTDEETEALEVR